MAGGIEQLTDREKRVLRLLASGHSVKSAASEQGITENAANELLRSARRKLGIGSSREAARLLAEAEGHSQKIRDEKSGVPVPGGGKRSILRSNRGIIAMLVTALAASAAFMILSTQSGNSSAPDGGSAGGGGARGAGPSDPAAPSGGPAAPPASTRAARVVRTTPGQGAVIEPGPFRMSVTFDRPMAPQSYAFSHDAAEAPFPQCAGQPQLSPDGLTYSWDCVAQAGARYVVYLNRPPHIGFVDAETRTPAQAARMAFTVAGEAPAVAAPAPKVVRTVPADGAELPRGPFTVAITFDRPMAPQSYSFVRSDEGAYPDCTGTPQLSADRLTYSVECNVQAPGKYVMYFNRPPYLAFRDGESGAAAEPRRLEFTVVDR